MKYEGDLDGAPPGALQRVNEHIGFEGVVHGGMIATVIDEAMVWAATWAGKRFCVCGEMSVRFRRPSVVGEELHLEAPGAVDQVRRGHDLAVLRDHHAGSDVADPPWPVRSAIQGADHHHGGRDLPEQLRDALRVRGADHAPAGHPEE